MSRLQIFPPVAIVYPNDRQTFTAKAVPAPPMWVAVSDSGDIKSDFSLEVDGAGSQTSANSAHLLQSGSGIIEFTIDDQCRPDTGGFFQFTGFVRDENGFHYGYFVRLNPTSVQVTDELNNTIYFEAYSTVSGDVYRLELVAGFRLYRNGTLLHSRVSLATQTVFPHFFSVFILEPSIAAPTRVPPPRLIGDWRVGPYISYTTPSHGALATVGTPIQTEYFAGVIPGTYTLIGQIEPSADAGNVQRAAATINIPPLFVLGPTEITMQPGAKIRPKTNYDAAQNALITWAVASGGGSFTQGEYTAPSTNSISIIRATADVNDQVADIRIIVPPVISNANNYKAAKASEQIDFDHNLSLLPVYVGKGLPVEGTGNVIPPLPEDIRINDILLLFVESANEAVSTPSGGWAAVADSPQGTGTGGGATSTRLSVFWKRLAGGETAPTVTDPGDHVVAQILAFRGCISTGDPWDVTSGDTGASSTSVSIPGDTTTVANCLIVLAVANATDNGTPQTSGFTNTDLANLAERTDFNSTAGNGGGFAVATGEKAAAGAYGATTATLANASVQGRMSIALKPAAITWSASIGSINSSSGIWTAPSLTGQTARITVGNGTLTKIIEIDVLEVFPFSDFSLPVSWDRNLSALVGMSEDRSSRSVREKAPPFDSYPIKLLSRTLANCNTLDAFFDAHGFGKMFILDDSIRGIRKVGWFESAIRHEARDECDIDIAFQFLEARL